jgi:quercetin dioxygenase-like cupin family protein
MSRVNVLLRGGAVAATDNGVGAGMKGPPLHHHDFDEAFYVVEGELTFQLGDELFTRRRGELAFAPRAVPHTFANHSGTDARTLIVITPAGFERYFDQMAARDAGVEPPASAMEPWPEVVKVGPQIDPAAAAAIQRGPAPPDDPVDAFRTSVLLRSEQSGGHVSAIQNAVPAGWGGPPLHHHDFDEAFYVLDGRLTFQLGEELTTAGPGELVFAPRGSHHTLANLSDRSARYLLLCTPAGFERYFDRMAADPPPDARKPFPETIVVGPPISPDATHGLTVNQRTRRTE